MRYLKLKTVEAKWNTMADVWLKAADQIFGWTNKPLRHREIGW